MTGRRADGRFVLPSRPARSALLDVPEDWRAGLELAGADVVCAAGADPRGAADLAVCTPARLPQALASGAAVVLVEGDVPRVPGRCATRWVVLLRRDEPVALAPVGAGHALRAAVAEWTPSTWQRSLVKRGLQTAARLSWAPGLPVLTVVTRQPAEPLVLRTARTLGAAGPLVPVVLTGGGSLRRRVATLLLRPGAADPHLVLKTERHQGGLERAHRDRRWSAAAAQAAAPGVHVPQVVAVTAPGDGPVSSLEEGAPGRPLSQLLTSDSGTARVALRTLTTWLAVLAARTGRHDPRPYEPPPQLSDPAGLLTQAVAAVADVPGVLTHGDLLHGGNVLVGRDRVSVVDWETATDHGPPLRDLLPTLGYGLAVLRVGPRPQAIADEVIRCALGRSPDSAELRSHLSSWTRALGLRPDVVGPLSLLAWAHHGAQPAVHRAELLQAGLPVPQWDSVPELVARAWLAHPGLGLRWPALLSCS